MVRLLAVKRFDRCFLLLEQLVLNLLLQSLSIIYHFAHFFHDVVSLLIDVGLGCGFILCDLFSFLRLVFFSGQRGARVVVYNVHVLEICVVQTLDFGSA